MRDVLLFLAGFLACGVEMVEALTIVLAVGVTRGWRSTLIGVGTATLALAAIVATLGPALTAIPINALRLLVGGLLLIFGLQWLRKAILRAGGIKARHDEAVAYRRQVAAAESAGALRRANLDWYSFTVAFKGVLLEGLEAAFIVVTVGGNQHNVGLVAVSAGCALVVVVTAGVVVHAPLSRIPENTMKFVVGTMLTTFGTFWASEGAGVKWPGGDAAIPAVLAFVLLLGVGLTAALRRRTGKAIARPKEASGR
ncbi:MAG: COG4280 domain-containing protein [Acidimicrobiales bacterium]